MVLCGGGSFLNVPYAERAEHMAWIIGSHKIPYLPMPVKNGRWGVAAVSCVNEYGAEPEGIGCADVSVLLSKIPNPDGEDEGLVFKRTDIPLAWHTRPGVEDPNQLKLRKKG
jgi:hypothetical protein